MSKNSSLLRCLLRELQETIGQPPTVGMGDQHWAIKPDPQRSAINLLVTGERNRIRVWLFDPTIQEDGIHHMFIDDLSDIDEIVRLVSHRINRLRPCVANSRLVTLATTEVSHD